MKKSDQLAKIMPKYFGKTKCVEMSKDYCPTCWTKIETEELKKLVKELLELRGKLEKIKKMAEYDEKYGVDIMPEDILTLLKPAKQEKK